MVFGARGKMISIILQIALMLIFAYAPYVTKAAHTRVLNKVIESRSHGSNAIYRADVLKNTPNAVPFTRSVLKKQEHVIVGFRERGIDSGYYPVSSARYPVTKVMAEVRDKIGDIESAHRPSSAVSAMTDFLYISSFGVARLGR
jgi:hypothetical protein